MNMEKAMAELSAGNAVRVVGLFGTDPRPTLPDRGKTENAAPLERRPSLG